MGMMDDILGGFGFREPSAAESILGGSLGGAAGGSWGGALTAAIGAIGGGVEGYFGYKAQKEAAKTALELAELQQRATMPVAAQVPQLASPTGYVQPAYPVAPVAAPAAPTGYQPSRTFFTSGDQMAGITDPWIQAALGGLQGALGGYYGAPPGITPVAVEQPPGVPTSAGGMPLPGSSAQGAISPAAGLRGFGTLFRPSQQAAWYPMRMVHQQHPTSGQMHYWRYVGKPLLFRGDLTSCKRVQRVAKLAKRAGGGSSRRSPPSKSRRYVGRKRSANCKRARDSKGRYIKRR